MKKIKELTKYSKWWSKEKGITWAFKQGEDWFLIRNPEADSTNKPKSKNKNHPKTKPDSLFNSDFLWSCLASSIVGVFIGIGFWCAVTLLL